MYEKELYVFNKFMNQVLNINTHILIDENLNSIVTAHTDGYYIHVSKEWLKRVEDELEIFVMCMHEGFHCYQKKCIMEESLSPQIINQWEKEFNNYISPEESISGHWNQKIEQTATIFSDIALYNLAGIHLTEKITRLFNPEDVEFIKRLNFEF